MGEYSNEELVAIYELGRLYFEMGYFVPAERIFNGLAVVDGGKTPARLGLGLVKLERGLFQEAMIHLRGVLKSGPHRMQAKLALCAAHIGAGEIVRSQSILGEIAQELGQGVEIHHEQRRFYEALVLRCRQ